MAQLSLLLDTHVLLWWLADSPKLNKRARVAIDNADAVWVSSVSAWEIESKRSRGLLDAPEDLERVLRLNNFRPLSVTIPHAIGAARLPFHHRDPIDRILIAQAASESLTIITHDRMLVQYQVPIFVV